jgi:hypothetical protein
LNGSQDPGRFAFAESVNRAYFIGGFPASLSLAFNASRFLAISAG